MNQLDRRGFAAIVKSPGSTALLRITDLGSPAALVIGTVVAAAVAAAYDRWRAAACVAGPLLTAVLVEYVLKPQSAGTTRGSSATPRETWPTWPRWPPPSR